MKSLFFCLCLFVSVSCFAQRYEYLNNFNAITNGQPIPDNTLFNTNWVIISGTTGNLYNGTYIWNPTNNIYQLPGYNYGITNVSSGFWCFYSIYTQPSFATNITGTIYGQYTGNGVGSAFGSPLLQSPTYTTFGTIIFTNSVVVTNSGKTYRVPVF